MQVFDVNLRPPYDDRALVESLLGRADWVKRNRGELERIAAWNAFSGSLEQRARALSRRHDLACIGVTPGKAGAAMLRDDAWSTHAGYAVEVVDTVGCGDAWLAGWLHALLAGVSSERALARACAMVAMQRGGNPPIDAAALAAWTGD